MAGFGKQMLGCGIVLMLLSPATSAGPMPQLMTEHWSHVQLVHDTGAEVAFWETVKNAEDPRELEAYLDAFPNGVFAALARIRLTRMKSAKQSALVPASEDTEGPAVQKTIPSRPTALRTLGHIGVDWRNAYRKGEFVGVKAVRVFAFGTASSAGLLPGDIATAIDRRVITSVDQFSNYLRSRNPGKTVEIEVARNGTVANIEIEIGDWLEQVWAAAHRGDADAARQLGNAYAGNDLIAPDFTASRNWLERAGQSGSASAFLDLGMQYLDGKGVEKDSGKAFFFVLKSAWSGSIEGQLQAARLYAVGRGVEKDAEAAFEWYRRAADNGNAAAMRSLGLQYDVGGGVEKDIVQAAHWYQKAADAGNLDATADLGQIHQNGEAGRKKDLVEAVRLYRKAADGGSAKGLYHLGWLYQWGDGVVQDRDEAIRLYRLAAPESVVARISLKSMDVPLFDAKEIQNLLNKLGFDAGPVDGAIGGKSREAIADFQRTFGMVGTGEPTLDLVKALRKARRQRDSIAARQLKKTPAVATESETDQPSRTSDSDLSDLGELD